MGGQQRTPPGRMVLLTISVALLSIFASPGSCQETPAESGSGNGSNHSVMASNPSGMVQPLELSEHGSTHSAMEQPLELLEDGEQPLELLEDGEQPLELIEDGEVPVEIPDDKCCSEKTVGGIH